MGQMAWNTTTTTTTTIFVNQNDDDDDMTTTTTTTKIINERFTRAYIFLIIGIATFFIGLLLILSYCLSKMMPTIKGPTMMRLRHRILTATAKRHSSPILSPLSTSTTTATTLSTATTKSESLQRNDNNLLLKLIQPHEPLQIISEDLKRQTKIITTETINPVMMIGSHGWRKVILKQKDSN
ncbi:uncharacterized protein LOC124495462 isoform X2 [Dermatophagoides farinae]|uniref:Uncharacterized protein n=1 Tax=Dermatophagoides farinae TaxID=6954 RepID=A0A922I6Y9_DERFA|nr:uncharacterized protein LOC124495462 isoform X2 [Dermatophagoides farinae]KAH9526552.1 hypothetical protein DERF_000628 [Dermatophagoides farinae]